MIPRQTMLIELPIAVIKNSSNKDTGSEVHPLHEGAGRQQDLFGQSGCRPVLPAVAKKYAKKYPARPGSVQDQ